MAFNGQGAFSGREPFGPDRFGLSLARPRLAVPVVARAIDHVGINFAGFEYGSPSVNDFDVNQGPNAPTVASLDYFAERGINMARIPYLIERMQPGGNSTAIGSDAKSAAYLAAVKGFAAAARQRGYTVMLEPHNYGKRRYATDNFTVDRYVGSAEFPVAAFADFHARMASEPGFYAPSDHIDLCNEPTTSLAYNGQQVVTAQIAWINACIAAIRQTGRANVIHVPGMAYSQASGWSFHGTNQLPAAIVDPAPAGYEGAWTPRWMIHLHQYFDNDQAGNSGETRYGIWPSRLLREAREAALRGGFQLCLGEFTATYSTNEGQAEVNAGRNAIHDVMHEAMAYPEAWAAMVTWRGGGRIGGNDITALDPWSGGWTAPNSDLQPADGNERDKLTIIKRYTGAKVQDRPGSAIDLDLARGYAKGGEPSSLLSCTRGTARTALEESGVPLQFGTNQLRITRRGLRIDPAIINDNLILTQDFKSAAWSKSVQSGASLTLSDYADPADGQTYTRLQMTGDYRTNLQYRLTHAAPAVYGLEIKSLGAANQYVGLYGGGGSGTGDKDINIDGSRPEYPRGTWFRAFHSLIANSPWHIQARGSPVDILIRNAKINLGSTLTPFVDASYDPDLIGIGGALLAALQGDCTIVVQTRDLSTAAVVRPILSGTVGGAAISLLTREANGSVSTALGGALATAAQGLNQWGSTGSEWGSRQVGLSKRAGRVVIGATGTPAVGADNAPGEITAAQLGSLGGAYLGALVERITVYPVFRDTAAMNALLA